MDALNLAMVFAGNLLLATAGTLAFAFVVKLLSGFFNVVSERAVVWCVTLGFVLGKARLAEWKAAEPFGPDEAQGFGLSIGSLLALLLLWWFLYRRHRQEQTMRYGERS